MEEFMAFVTIDVWTMLFTWGNLIILFLLMKKFLFKPVNNILEKRKQEIGDMYDKAESDKKEAQKLLGEYSEKIQSANVEADEIIKTAKELAVKKQDEILSEANSGALKILERAEKNIELEKSKAKAELLSEVSSLSVMMASKILEKDISAAEHKEIIDKFINEMGDINDVQL